MRLRNAGRKVAMAYMLKFRSAPDTIIHHRVGMRRMLHIEPPDSVGGCISLAPRTGSGSSNNAGISISAGAAAKAIAVRHPYAWASDPLKKKLSAPPTGTPSMNSARTRERLSGGKRSPSQLVAAGAQPASPTPTPIREKSNMLKLPAKAADAVSEDQITIAAAKSFLRLAVSAMRPSGSPTNA